MRQLAQSLAAVAGRTKVPYENSVTCLRKTRYPKRKKFELQILGLQSNIYLQEVKFVLGAGLRFFFFFSIMPVPPTERIHHH